MRSISLFLLALLAFSGPHCFDFDFRKEKSKEKRNLLRRYGEAQEVHALRVWHGCTGHERLVHEARWGTAVHALLRV